MAPQNDPPDYLCFSSAVSTYHDELNSIDEWAKLNGLTLNLKKSDAIIFKSLMLLLVTWIKLLLPVALFGILIQLLI